MTWTDREAGSAQDRTRRVALVHRYFHPDVTSYAQMLDRFAAHLAAIGHDVTVLCGPPSYNAAYAGPDVPSREIRHGYTVRRLRVPSAAGRWRRLAGSAVFPLRIAAHLVTRRRRYDVVSVTTIPPVVMGLAGRAARLRSRHTRVVYHCMDLYPEAATTLGLSQNGALARSARHIDNSTVRAASRTIVLSDDMRTTLRERGVDTTGVVVCNNFILDDADTAVPSSNVLAARRRRFIFAGNVGRFQGVETLVSAIELACRHGADAEFVFLGAGRLVNWVEDEAARRGLPISVWPHRPLREAMGLIQTADVGVVSLAPGVARAAFPSKLMTYVELGLSVLAVVEPETELARLVTDHGLGAVAPPGDDDAIAEAIVRLATAELPAPCAVQRTGRSLFGAESTLARWTELYGLETA